MKEETCSVSERAGSWLNASSLMSCADVDQQQLVGPPECRIFPFSPVRARVRVACHIERSRWSRLRVGMSFGLGSQSKSIS